MVVQRGFSVQRPAHHRSRPDRCIHHGPLGCLIPPQAHRRSPCELIPFVRKVSRNCPASSSMSIGNITKTRIPWYQRPPRNRGFLPDQISRPDTITLAQCPIWRIPGAFPVSQKMSCGIGIPSRECRLRWLSWRIWRVVDSFLSHDVVSPASFPSQLEDTVLNQNFQFPQDRSA